LQWKETWKIDDETLKHETFNSTRNVQQKTLGRDETQPLNVQEHVTANSEIQLPILNSANNSQINAQSANTNPF
jgi:hypothetical protein